MRFVTLDFETYSETDIKSAGAFKYMEDPKFEILLMAYAFDDDIVEVVDFASGEKWPDGFLEVLKDPFILKIAHNAAFERQAIVQATGIYSPPEQWLDTMHLSAQCGLPLSLDGVSKALNFDEDTAKMKEGKALIRYFCGPCKPTKVNGGRTRNLPEHAPEKWKMFKEYCRQDVVAEREIYNTLRKWMPNPTERKFWCLDARINEKGVRIDKQLAAMAVAMDNRYKEELTEAAVALTGLDNPKSVSQIKNWLYDQEGKDFPSLNKKVIADVVSQLETPEAKQFMAIRTELSKSSTAKYEAMMRSMGSDDHVRGCFQFYGANRTGRFAGRLVQFQNMSKNEMPDIAACRTLVRNGKYTQVKSLYDGVSGPLSELVRTAIIPEDGHQWLVADFSAIEARVIAWFADEDWRLDVFRNGGDIYCQSASQMFKVPVVKHGENGHLRQKGKVAELACGYGGGIGALKAFGADKMGMTEEEMQETVDMWRESSPKIVQMWWDIGKAAARSIMRRAHVDTQYKGVSFDFEDGILWMNLPCGRSLAYFGAKYEDSAKMRGKKTINYMGVDQQTKRWTKVETYGPKLVENLVQATARDCLRESMFALDDAGFDIRVTVHDEILCTEPKNGRTVEEMAEIMGRPIPWAPGLPLRADGYACDFYLKD